MSVFDIIIYLVLVTAIAYVTFRWRRRARQKYYGKKAGLSPSQQKEKLLRMVMNNESTASRLIEFERSKNPSASEEELIRNAVDRLERDRR